LNFFAARCGAYNWNETFLESAGGKDELNREYMAGWSGAGGVAPARGFLTPIAFEATILALFAGWGLLD
jgi:hypothetical protein